MACLSGRYGGRLSAHRRSRFLGILRSLPSPRFYEILKQAEPLTAPYGYRRAENRLRYFEKLPRYLEGFLATGDAVYAFNPVYGQGMTVAAMASLALDESLKRQRKQHGAPTLAGLAKAFQTKLAGVIAGPWQMATGQDVLWPACEGGTQPDRITKMINGYMERVIRTMPYSPVVATAFFYVQNMLKPPTTLFHPKMLWNVLTTRLPNLPKASNTRLLPSMESQVASSSGD